MRRLMNAALVALGLLGGAAALAPGQASMATGTGVAVAEGLLRPVQYRPRYAPPPRPYYRRHYAPPPRAYRRPYGPRPRYVPPPRRYYRR